MDLQIKRGKVIVKSTAAVQLQRKIKRGKVVVKSAAAVQLQWKYRSSATATVQSGTTERCESSHYVNQKTPRNSSLPISFWIHTMNTFRHRLGESAHLERWLETC